MPWPTVMAALALYLTHTHTQHRTQGHVLTVAVIVISFVLYECVGLCVCGWERATFFVALFRLLRWHLMKQKWHLCKSWRLVLQYFCCILQYFCVSQHNFKTRRMPKIYTHTQTQLWQSVCVFVFECAFVCVSVCMRMRRVARGQLLVKINTTIVHWMKERWQLRWNPRRLSHISVSVWRAFCSAGGLELI